MSEKDIKVKPQTTTKSVKNAPKSVEHSAKTAAWDIKTVAKDTLVKNTIDKQLDTRQSEQPQRAEVEATEQVENTYYSTVDTVYQKGKHFAENKLKQHRQQVKTRQNHTSDIPIHNGNLSKTNAELIKVICQHQMSIPKICLILLYPQNLCQKQRKATYAHTAKLRPTS